MVDGYETAVVANVVVVHVDGSVRLDRTSGYGLGALRDPQLPLPDENRVSLFKTGRAYRCRPLEAVRLRGRHGVCADDLNSEEEGDVP